MTRLIFRFRTENDIATRALFDVIDAVVKNKCSDEEKAWIDKIEMSRKRLNNSSSEISITDYGAGTPDLNLTAEGMNQGRVVIKTVGKFCREVSKSDKWTLLLFKLVRKFRPVVCIEMGTAVGISAAYLTAALELNNQGKLITLEGAESLALLARKNLETLGLKNVTVVIGRFKDTLQKVLEENAPIPFVFLDGHHDKNATIEYFRQILPYLSDGTVLVFDDINWSQGMTEAWKIVQRDKNIKVSVDLDSVGICIFTKSAVEKNRCFKMAI